MAKIYKVNGNKYTYNEFYWFLYDKLYDYWKDGTIITDDDVYEYSRFIDRQLATIMDGIENFGEVMMIGEFDFWAEEEE